jgi:hypothetical protein
VGLALLWHTTAQASTHRVALVIEHGGTWSGSRVIRKCIEIAQDAVSGLALLELAGVNSGQPPQVYDWGGGAFTVCQIDREPLQVPDRCFGPTSGPNWSDWSISSGGWHARSSGPGGYELHDGDVEGWTYTPGFGSPPPSTQFSQICPSVTNGVALPSRRPTATSSSATASAAISNPKARITASTSEPSLEAIAPTVGATAKAVLAATGPRSGAPTPDSSAGVWTLLLVSSALLIGLGAINLRRRRRT